MLLAVPKFENERDMLIKIHICSVLNHRNVKLANGEDKEQYLLETTTVFAKDRLVAFCV
jgi:hypothetical protein